MSTDTPSPTDNSPSEPSIDSDEADEADAFEDPKTFRPPDIRDTRFGPLGAYLAFRNDRRKRKKYATKGYVKWYLLDGSFPDAKFIQPKLNGGGVPEYKHDGTRYIFPKEAMVPSQREGMWTAMHAEGQADPINLRDDLEYGIPGDRLREYLDTGLSSSPPGLFDKLDLTPQKLLQYAVYGFIAFVLFQAAMNGGLPGM